jgi:hypothetical protein
MAGINQLPAGAEGVAAFSLIYSSISWICSIMLIWCARLHGEAWSCKWTPKTMLEFMVRHKKLTVNLDISLLAYFALISDTASIVQQAHDITSYRDLLAGQFDRKTRFQDNPELAIANGSYGLDLVLYYIR